MKISATRKRLTKPKSARFSFRSRKRNRECPTMVVGGSYSCRRDCSHLAETELIAVASITSKCAPVSSNVRLETTLYWSLRSGP